MKKAMAAIGAAVMILATSFVAYGDEAKGTIMSIDATAGTVTLSDGKVYVLPQHLAKASILKVGDKVTVAYAAGQAGNEPPRVFRRPFGLSHAAIAGCSSMA